MTHFYNITSRVETVTNGLFEKACAERNLTYVPLYTDEYDRTQVIDFQRGDLLYRTHAGTSARMFEHSITDPVVTTLYPTVDDRLRSTNRQVAFKKNGLPVPRTINHATTNRELLHTYVQYLGGLPIVIKDSSGSHGVGVMKADSFDSLVSIVDFLVSKKFSFVLQQFIHVKSSARLIILGDRIVDSIEYHAPEGDFRSNVGEKPNVIPKKFSQDVEGIAVRAAQIAHLEFGGIDILIDSDGAPYITELNYPCFFGRAQIASGTDIAGMILDFMVEKSKRT